MYRITFKKSAAKELEHLPAKIVKNISPAINNLSENPRPDGCKKLKGSQEGAWRIRIGDYRVLYIIDDIVRIIDIQKVGHRKDIYKH